MRVIFVSHQWAGYQHPDPDNQQFHCLQRTLQKLANGATGVENDWKQQVVFGVKDKRPKEWWKKIMHTTYIWFDYMCMPQPSSVKVADNRGTAGQDHSKGPSADSKMLAKAVASLPAYIEQSFLMLVLVPTGEHQERKGEVVDWCSWRGRGWCRLEFIAATLSRRKDMRVMVVQAAEKVPEFVFSADSLSLQPGLGKFSCCTR
jgi:hypothetical protein